MLVTLANVLLRQANKTTNPRAYLDDIITASWDKVTEQGGAITSTSVNGKSVTLQVQPGTSTRDIMAAASLALGALEQGLRGVPRSPINVIR